jgi:hypothetical protein
MNSLNTATLEACQRLVKAGIVLETEAVWYSIYGSGNKYFLVSESEYQQIADRHSADVFTSISAPSMAEVWRELPEDNEEMAILIHDWLVDARFILPTTKILPCLWIGICRDINRLIDLFIWVRKEKV